MNASLRGPLWTGALALALAPQQDGPVLAERAAIAGMPGFMSVSTLTYHDAPELPNELVAIYVFPDRVVWRRRGLAGRAEERTLSYRAGDAYWLVEAGSKTSVRQTDGERDALALQMELRRAMTIWPDGFEWSGEETLRSVDLGRLGSLVAVLGKGARPRRVTSFGPDGTEFESFSEIEWRETRGRVFPHTFELAWQGTAIWTEEVRTIATNLEFLDYSFRPPDRRPELELVQVDLGRPTHIDLRRATVRRTALPAGLDWSAAFERARLLWNEGANELAELGRELERGANFELTAKGAPGAVILVVDGPPLDPPPAGWTWRREVPAVSLFVEGPPESTRRLLEALRRAVPAGARADRPFLRTDPAAGGRGRSQLVLPLRP